MGIQQVSKLSLPFIFQAFELAHLLGISCPLTPGAMISATIPDKLLVSSFLFNMHQYFTRAVPSAIAKDSTQNGQSHYIIPKAGYTLCMYNIVLYYRHDVCACVLATLLASQSEILSQNQPS